MVSNRGYKVAKRCFWAPLRARIMVLCAIPSSSAPSKMDKVLLSLRQIIQVTRIVFIRYGFVTRGAEFLNRKSLLKCRIGLIGDQY